VALQVSVIQITMLEGIETRIEVRAQTLKPLVCGVKAHVHLLFQIGHPGFKILEFGEDDEIPQRLAKILAETHNASFLR
jgi:hypothetical protein